MRDSLGRAQNLFILRCLGNENYFSQRDPITKQFLASSIYTLITDTAEKKNHAWFVNHEGGGVFFFLFLWWGVGKGAVKGELIPIQ